MDYEKLIKIVPETVQIDFKRGKVLAEVIKKVIDAETSSKINRLDAKKWLSKALHKNNEIISEPDAVNGYKRKLMTAFSGLKLAYKDYLAAILGELANDDIDNKEYFILLQTLFTIPAGGRVVKKNIK